MVTGLMSDDLCSWQQDPCMTMTPPSLHYLLNFFVVK